jgi:hypothetical protein
MPRMLLFLNFAILTLAFTVSTGAQTVGRDTFEASGFSSLWSRTHGATLHDSGGANATHGFASLNFKGSELEGNLATADQPGLSDFAIEFYFRMQNPTNGQFNLRIEDSKTSTDTPSKTILSLHYDAQNGWGASINSNGIAACQPMAGMKFISPRVWYRFRFVGREWGETNAHYNLQLLDPNGDRFMTSATNVIFFQGSDPAIPLARHFIVANTADDNSGFDVAEVNITAITPYKGPVITGVNPKTLFGKVMCGYQGWFGAPGDGSSEPGWRHWTKSQGPLADGNAKIDLWPDVSELDASQRFPTGFKMADGSPAEVFSSFERPTVLKHFEWMQNYGVDGVFIQRFANGLKNQPTLEHDNTVLASCREGANLHGRAYAVMYDLSGLPAGHIDDVINDWRALKNQMVITEDPAYLNHRGKPVVAIWGIGFNDGRKYSLAECRRLVEFFKNDPEDGGCTVMLGVPANWRELKGDALNDPGLLGILAMADIISPWTVGRYANPAGAARYAENNLKPDLAWCRQRGIDFLPVVFPGFSWHNMYGTASAQIPRLRGQFLWSQFLEAKRANVSMVYVAMFDEVDEGTAIFKCVNDVPVGQKSKFVTFEGLPSDFYLKMVGDGTRLIHNETSLRGEASFSQRD